jgi:hypothetical protein
VREYHAVNPVFVAACQGAFSRTSLNILFSVHFFANFAAGNIRDNRYGIGKNKERVPVSFDPLVA